MLNAHPQYIIYLNYKIFNESRVYVRVRMYVGGGGRKGEG